MRIRNLLLAVAVFTFSAAAAAQWVKLGETHDTLLYQNPSTLQKEGSLRRVWEIQDFKKDIFGDGVRSLGYQAEYDCSGGRMRVLSLHAFKSRMATGAALDVPFSTSDWVPIPLNSIAAISLTVVCSM
jgi:hypothetical protein